MKKHLLRAVLIAALAVTAAFSAAAFDAEPVESASERVSTANETALSEEAASLAMDANGEIELTFGLQAIPQVNVGTTEALNIGDLEGTELMKDGKLALSNMGNRSVAQKDGKLGADFSDGGNIINTTDFGTERPLGISLDYQGTSTWASVINNGGTTYWNYKKWRPQATTDANWVSVSNKSEGGKCAQALIDSGDTNEEYRTIVEQAGKEA